MPTKSPSPDLRPRAFCTHQPSPAAPHQTRAPHSRPRAVPALPPRGVKRALSAAPRLVRAPPKVGAVRALACVGRGKAYAARCECRRALRAPPGAWRRVDGDLSAWCGRAGAALRRPRGGPECPIIDHVVTNFACVIYSKNMFVLAHFKGSYG